MASSNDYFSVNDTEGSPAPSAASTTLSMASRSVFSSMMQPKLAPKPFNHDKCTRPASWSQYNHNYDPYNPPNDILPASYTPYVFGEPLFNDCPALTTRIPKHHALSGSSKRPRTAWTWKLGYAFNNSSKGDTSLVWACKLCHHDPKFAPKPYTCEANTLKNAEKHLRIEHYLDEGGDIWRQKFNTEQPPQPSGPVNGGYEKVLPFRQQEFKNALLEWIVCDNIKHRKACSKRLKRCFQIANVQAANAIPESASTVETWIHDLYTHFEPGIRLEIVNAKSKVSITFDGWSSKHDKISVVGVVVHFINDKYEAVSRLIGLPELPGHSKTGVGKLCY